MATLPRFELRRPVGECAPVLPQRRLPWLSRHPSRAQLSLNPSAPPGGLVPWPLACQLRSLASLRPSPASDPRLPCSSALYLLTQRSGRRHAPLLQDIKPNNIGFIASGRLVIFDFGLASLWELHRRPSDEIPRKLTGETGSLRYVASEAALRPYLLRRFPHPPKPTTCGMLLRIYYAPDRYMAPEVALSKPYTHRAEVFSFALVLWEMAAHQKPYSGYTSEGQFKGALLRGVTPQIAKQWPAGLGSLLMECWAPDESQRPEFCSVVPRLKAMQVTAKASEEDSMQSGGCFGRASQSKVAPLPS